MLTRETLYDAGQRLIDRHGAAVEEHAARMLRQHLRKRNLQAAASWLEIGQAIETLHAAGRQGHRIDRQPPPQRPRTALPPRHGRALYGWVFYPPLAWPMAIASLAFLLALAVVWIIRVAGCR